MYSFNMSFWVVPLISAGETPCDSATLMYNESKVEAVELIVIEVLTLFSGMFSKQVIMSLIELIATPVLPTSPSD
jgi:hypothetical protein